MSVQTSVSTNFEAAIAGGVRGMTGQVRSRIAEVALIAGLLACQGTADDQAKLPTSSGEVAKILGAVPSRVAADSRFPSTNTSGAYQIGGNVDLIAEGAVWLQVEEAVAAGDNVYVRFATNGGLTQKGAVRNDDSDPGGGATAALLSGAKFLTTTSGSGLALVALNLP